MHCARNTLKFPRFLGILAHAQTVCTRLSFRVRKEPGVEASSWDDKSSPRLTSIPLSHVHFFFHFSVYDTITTQILSEKLNGNVVAGCTMNIIIFMRRNRNS